MNSFPKSEKNDKPTGGFPPLYVCEDRDLKQNGTKQREYSSNKNAVSISDILKTKTKNLSGK